MKMTLCLPKNVLFSTSLVIASFWMIPDKAEAWISPPWIDKIALVPMEQKSLAKSGNFIPYFKQLEVGSEAAVKGAYDGKRKGKNRFLEMLEKKEGGISAEAGHHIFAAIVKAVPYAILLPLKSEDKLDPDEKALIDHLKRFTASIKDQDERATLSF